MDHKMELKPGGVVKETSESEEIKKLKEDLYIPLSHFIANLIRLRRFDKDLLEESKDAADKLKNNSADLLYKKSRKMEGLLNGMNPLEKTVSLSQIQELNILLHEIMGMNPGAVDKSAKKTV